LLSLAKRPDSGIRLTDHTRKICHVCIEAKSTRKYSTRKASRVTRPLGRIHIDIVGGGQTLEKSDIIMNSPDPMATDGQKYFMLITDDATRFRWVYFMVSREAKIISGYLRHWSDHIRNLGFQYPAQVRSDNEFGQSDDIMVVITSWGAVLEPSNPDSPWQNGTSERANRIILEKARTLMIGSGLPEMFWKDAIQLAVDLTNGSPTSTPLYNDSTPGGTTLDEDIKPSPHNIPKLALFNSPPRFDQTLPFGAWIYYHLHGNAKPVDKMDSRNTIGRVIGFPAHNVYRVWDPQTDRIFNIENVTPTGMPLRMSAQGGVQTENLAPKESTSVLSPDEAVHTAQQTLNLMESLEIDDDQWVRPAKDFKAYAARTKAMQQANVPRNYKEAMQSEEASRWLAGMQEEIDKFNQRHLSDIGCPQRTTPYTRKVGISEED
jgi:hypothetical protein